MFDYDSLMKSQRGAVAIGGDARLAGHAGPVRLLDRSGVPMGTSPLTAALTLEEAVLPNGRPLFPSAPHPAQLAGEIFDDVDRAWYSMRPGPDLGIELAGLDPDALGEDGLVEAIRAHGRMIAHHEAQLSVLIAELAGRPTYRQCDDAAQHDHDAMRSAASEVSLAMSWTPSYADAKVAHAVRLSRSMPATLAALAEGRIDAYRAKVIDEETASLAEHPEVASEVESAVLRRAENKTGPALRAYAKRKVIAVAPQMAEKRRQAAREARRVDKPFSECDGMGSMQLYGPIEDLAALFTAVDAAARARRDAAARKVDVHGGQEIASDSYPDVGVGLSALRFDVLADLGWSALNAGHLGCCGVDCAGASQRLGTQHGRAATVNVTVPFFALDGMATEPGELIGYGPITTETARQIAGGGTLRRLLTDPASGQLLDYGTTRYSPPRHLAEHVIARDRTCRFPTCNWPAEACQLDHTDAFHADGSGGPTAASNFGPLHGRHHNDKTHHGFTFVQPEPGTFVITTPAGLTYQVDPEVIGPVPDPAPPKGTTGSDPPAYFEEELGEPPPF